jgi:hypothetical protein
MWLTSGQDFNKRFSSAIQVFFWVIRLAVISYRTDSPMKKTLCMRKFPFYFILFSAIIILPTGCRKNDSVSSPVMTIPILTTSIVGGITQTTAQSGGVVASAGGAGISELGVCWSLSVNPTTSDIKTDEGTGTGSFSSEVSGLKPGTAYYLRAYATNSFGTSYGNEQSFTTLQLGIPVLTTSTIDSITQTTALSGGSISTDNGAQITARGVCWSTSVNPTILDQSTSDGTGTGNFSALLTGLAKTTTYYLRAYATNSFGTAYGDELAFTSFPHAPTLSTGLWSTTEFFMPPLPSVYAYYAGGHITSDGGSPIIADGIILYTYSKIPSYSPSRDSIPCNNGLTNFSDRLGVLPKGTSYAVIAYAANSAGIGYGDSVSFSVH